MIRQESIATDRSYRFGPTKLAGDMVCRFVRFPVNDNCGLPSQATPDALCRPPYEPAGWFDLTGDGKADLLRADQPAGATDVTLYRKIREGIMPFALQDEVPIQTTPSHSQVLGRSVTSVDVDLDGKADLVIANRGKLFWYRSIGAPGAFADPIPISDSSGTPLAVDAGASVGAIDLNGDGNLDFLVAEGSGPGKKIRTVLCITPGSPQGYALGPYLSTPEQSPIAPFGGPLWLAAADVDDDGRPDVVMSVQGTIWLLRNVGSGPPASFSLAPLTVSHTTAAYVELLGSRAVRLRFGVPTVANQTQLNFRDLPTSRGPMSGTLTIVKEDPRLRLFLPLLPDKGRFEPR